MKTTFKLFLMIAVLGSISFFSSCNKDDNNPNKNGTLTHITELNASFNAIAGISLTKEYYNRLVPSTQIFSAKKIKVASNDYSFEYKNDNITFNTKTPGTYEIDAISSDLIIHFKINVVKAELDATLNAIAGTQLTKVYSNKLITSTQVFSSKKIKTASDNYSFEYKNGTVKFNTKTSGTYEIDAVSSNIIIHFKINVTKAEFNVNLEAVVGTQLTKVYSNKLITSTQAFSIKKIRVSSDNYSFEYKNGTVKFKSETIGFYKIDAISTEAIIHFNINVTSVIAPIKNNDHPKIGYPMCLQFGNCK